MSLFRKFVTRSRVRKAARSLALEPCARNYVALAREYVVAGDPDEVLRVCSEGLEIHPDEPELSQLAERARSFQLDKRVRALQSELEVSPRPALWRELCDLLMEAGRLDKAEKAAMQWYRSAKDGESRWCRARVHAARFLEERSSGDGLQAWELAEKAKRAMGQDPRPLELQMQIAMCAGAWKEARTAVSRLLEMRPGDPALESSFRHVMAMCEAGEGEPPSLEDALRRVERTGRLSDDEPEVREATEPMAVRPMLKELSADSEVQAALYLRGQTALVQGPRGATAERTARVIREVVQASRAAARRMGLGQPVEVLAEGGFGSLLLAPGDQGASAVWCLGPIKVQHERLLKSLSGMAGLAEESAA